MIQQLLNNLTEEEQRTFFTQFTKDKPTDTKDDSDSDSFHSAASCENVMKCDASPFFIPSPKVTNYQPDPESSTEIELQKQTGVVLQDKLNKQIVVMKAQHQFIQNLQRANNQLKYKLKLLESNNTSGIAQKDELVADGAEVKDF